jgi:hypothetical protein
MAYPRQWKVVGWEWHQSVMFCADCARFFLFYEGCWCNRIKRLPGSVECPICYGEGAVDSGGSLPWGEWVMVKCGYCDGTGKVHVS